MNSKHPASSILSLLVALFVVACGRAPSAIPAADTATPTPFPPTATPIPPSPTPTPSPTATVPPAEPTQLQQTVHEFNFHKITSQALAGNLVGDPAERDYWVYVPPSYADGDRRYPVVYVLHWFTGDEGTCLYYVNTYYKYMLKKGTVQEMIFVFPNADNAFGGSQYLSSGTIGDYETYIARELVAQVDANYRTIPDPDSRGVTGCSMGGDGSMHLALTFPDVYGTAVSMSGTYDVENDPMIPAAAAAFTHIPEDFEALESYLNIDTRIAGLVSFAAGAAPNPDKPPFYLDWPFEVVDGEGRVVPEVIEKMTAADVSHDVEEYLQQPLRVPNIMIYHGTRDQMAPVELARSFDALLTERGIQHDYVEVESGHCNYNVTPVLQYLSDHLVAEQP